MTLTITMPQTDATPKKKRTRKTPETPAAPKPVNKVRATRENVLGGTFFVLALAVLSVSLPHLAQGMHATLGVGWFAASALAVLFDLSQIAAEGFLLTLAKDKGEQLAAKGVIVGATLVSVVYNGMAFLSHAENAFGTCAALALAVMLPVGVLTLSYLGQRCIFRK